MKYLKTFNLYSILESREFMNDLPDTTGLFVDTEGGTSLVLYDTSFVDNGNVKEYDLGVLGYVSLAEYDNYFSSPSVAGEKGYGPLIYEIGMMYSGDKGLMLSRSGDVRGEALNVWVKFYDSNRNDIKKKTLKLEESNFSFSIIHGEENTHENINDKLSEFEAHIEEGDEKVILAYNTKMYMKKNNKFLKLIEYANKWLERNDLTITDIERMGNDYFHYRYSY